MKNLFTRRTFGRLLGGSAALGSVTGVNGIDALAQQAAAHPAAHAVAHTLGGELHFPKGFLWGSATASYQVEGAIKEEGRGPSIWDTFSHIAGKTNNGDTGDVADDHFHRYKEDIALMKALGLKTYRFSIAWSRVFPTGAGAPNPQGLDFYNRMLDSLLAAGIQPYCTLYHWDLPQALEDKGGWQNHDTAKAFADYAGYTAGKLSDRVKHFMTMNELRSFVITGYRDGRHAPGLHLNEKQTAQVAHHAVLGHGLAVGAIRAHAKPSTKVGLAENVSAVAPAMETPEYIAAAEKAMREENAMFTTVIQEGRYTDLYLKKLGANAPTFTPEELKAIGSPLDFMGINLYTTSYVRPDAGESGYAVIPRPSTSPRMASTWLYVSPEGLYWAPLLAAKLWKIKEIFITENGASAADVMTPDGHVYDTDRVMYLRAYLTQLHRALQAGAPVKGYFLWSLLDNYEWADGYDKRFGIHYVDFKTQKRTPKLSAEFYRAVIARNSLL